ncbi:MAG: sugar ABC transporter permease [Oscillospiraceae bacterium]|nr:sugar ABC transporter permease [Oscillospiraceae bacterium]
MNNIKQHYLSLRTKDAITGFLFTLPALAGLAAFFVVPFGITMKMSLTESMGSSKSVGLKNYSDVMGSAAFKLAAKNTFKFFGVALPCILILSLLIALLLFRNLKKYDIFRTFFVFPLVLPVSSVVLFFQIVFSDLGVVNGVLEHLGMHAADWTGEQAFWVLLILYLWKNTGYNVVLFLAALNSVPPDLYEAAALDGAGWRKKLTRITLPINAPHTRFILVISIVNLFKSFREAYILFGDHPDQSIYMIQHFMNNNFINLNYIRLSVGAALVFLVIFVLVGLLLTLRDKDEGGHE